MRQLPHQLKDPVYQGGLALLLISSLMLLVPITTVFGEGLFHGPFLINFSCTCVYFAILLTKGTLKRGRSGLHHLFLLLIMALVSAYSFNRSLAVFASMTPWFAVLQLIACVSLLCFIFFWQLPMSGRYLLCCLAGIALICFLYLAIYLSPLYLPAGILLPLLGLSAHTFIPLLLCIYILVLISKLSAANRRYWQPFIAGMVLPLAVVTAYSLGWLQQVKAINTAYQQVSAQPDPLPNWLRVAQRLPRSSFTEKIMQTGIVYSTSYNDSYVFASRPTIERTHDPLVTTSSILSDQMLLSRGDRLRILEAMKEARHQSQERLWSGDHLQTDTVSLHAELWPALRLAYSQMTLVVGNRNPATSFAQNPEEAIYTFYLPEGSVVTALSLWIDGREEKGRLSTRHKADSAYKAIVGVEKRDPSVVHWQEGNTVSVRVFPVAPGESRQFRIGITSPLAQLDDKLQYSNIYFKGPETTKARCDNQIRIHSAINGLELPAGFYVKGDAIISQEEYEPNWSLWFDAPPLGNGSFTFDQSSYTLLPAREQTSSLPASNIYLDLNAAWTSEELAAVLALTKDRQVYVINNKDSLVLLTDQNRETLSQQGLANNFSFFPFHRIPDPARSLVISKSTFLSPLLSDLKGTDFLRQSNDYFQAGNTIPLFHIGGQPSPYLRSLRERGLLHYQQGKLSALQAVLSSQQFSYALQDEHTVTLPHAGISIRRSTAAGALTASPNTQPGAAFSTAGTTTNPEGPDSSNSPAAGKPPAISSSPPKGPDHLMRLFVYNHILQQTGRRLVQTPEAEDSLIAEAAQAHVVTPFSSLVVLETKKDYDRFQIEPGNNNSLQQAALEGKGAVPEPQEWALLLLVLLTAGFIRFRSYRSKKHTV
ncbi:MAG: XrtN system VIT domain-containing protein [Candidatus Pseudobacter hemicellulosilyticus]|uniref:XrtN system VIT domain-containing protein n=1 Tax=Candidatus Pseudobacter hemicellulosilyticus TaxID=3121375 RepID=A0AAJ5WR48_9BACT|nr:MAG: XrtN system VIT domain-containing protein [Pseudobacter sp.]